MTDRMKISELHVYVQPKTKRYLRQWAFDEERSMASIIQDAIDAAIEKREEGER